jgi:hypothetical protein
MKAALPAIGEVAVNAIRVQGSVGATNGGAQATVPTLTAKPHHDPWIYHSPNANPRHLAGAWVGRGRCIGQAARALHPEQTVTRQG